MSSFGEEGGITSRSGLADGHPELWLFELGWTKDLACNMAKVSVS